MAVRNWFNAKHGRVSYSYDECVKRMHKIQSETDKDCRQNLL